MRLTVMNAYVGQSATYPRERRETSSGMSGFGKISPEFPIAAAHSSGRCHIAELWDIVGIRQQLLGYNIGEGYKIGMERIHW
jgi:hypothetical protein